MKKLVIVITFISLVSAIQGQPDQLISKRQYADKLFKEGFYDLAAVQYQQILDEFPDIPQVEIIQYQLGNSYFENRQYLNAQNAYLVYLYKFPFSKNSPIAQMKVADCFKKMEKYENAIQSYLSVFRYYPENTISQSALYKAASLAYQLNYLKKTESICKELLNLSIPSKIRFETVVQLIQVYLDEYQYHKAHAFINQCLEMEILPSEKAICYHYSGQLNYHTGFLQKAMNNFLLSNQNIKDSLQSVNYFFLGKISETLGENQNAIQYYENGFDVPGNFTHKRECASSLGKLYLSMEKYREAKETFLSILNTYSENEVAIRLALGQAYAGMDENHDAITQYQFVLDHTAPSSLLCKKATLLLSDLYYSHGRIQESISYLLKYLDYYPNDDLNPYILYQSGCRYLQPLNMPSQAYFIFQKLWFDFTHSSLVPESKYKYAEYLENNSQLSDAWNIYNEIIEQYPHSKYAVLAQEKNNRLSLILTKSGHYDLSGLITTLHEITDLSEQKKQYKIAASLFNYTQQYKDVLKHTLKSIQINTDPSITQKACLLSGKCYWGLYQDINEIAYRDSAIETFKHLYANGSDEMHIEAGCNLAAIYSTTNPRETISIYKAILEHPLEIKSKKSAFWKLIDKYVQIDSLEQAYKYLNHNDFANDLDIEKTLYFKGEVLSKLQQWTDSDSILNIYLTQYPNGRYEAQVLYLSGMQALRSKKDSTALKHFINLRLKYPDSELSNTILLKMGQLYLNRNNISRAKDVFYQILKQDSVYSFAHEVGLYEEINLPVEEAMLGLCDIHVREKQYDIAGKQYMEWMQRYPKKENQALAFSQLALIEETENRSEEAAYYLTKASEAVPSDSIYNILGTFYINNQKNSEAIQAFDKGMTLSQDIDRLSYMLSRIILAYIKMNQFSQAAVREKLFHNEYKKSDQYDNYCAEILIEKGNTYLNRKDFDQALETFDKVRDDYRRTAFLPEAELGLGKTYLITNRYDKALDILSELPEKYPNHPVLTHVYLNLGDHYFRSKQFQNSLSAFQKAAYDYNDPEINPVALRYLIRVYESLRMYDAALATTRHYITSYPNSDDVLQKKVQIGTFMMHLNEYSRAVEQFRKTKVLADADTETEIQYWIGKCFLQMGDFEQAILEFLKVKYVSKPTKLPWASTALYESGQAYMKLNRPVEAKKIFRKIIQTEGEASDLGRIARQRIDEIDSMEQK